MSEAEGDASTSEGNVLQFSAELIAAAAQVPRLDGTALVQAKATIRSRLSAAETRLTDAISNGADDAIIERQRALVAQHNLSIMAITLRYPHAKGPGAREAQVSAKAAAPAIEAAIAAAASGAPAPALTPDRAPAQKRKWPSKITARISNSNPLHGDDDQQQSAGDDDAADYAKLEERLLAVQQEAEAKGEQVRVLREEVRALQDRVRAAEAKEERLLAMQQDAEQVRVLREEVRALQDRVRAAEDVAFIERRMSIVRADRMQRFWVQQAQQAGERADAALLERVPVDAQTAMVGLQERLRRAEADVLELRTQVLSVTGERDRASHIAAAACQQADAAVAEARRQADAAVAEAETRLAARTGGGVAESGSDGGGSSGDGKERLKRAENAALAATAIAERLARRSKMTAFTVRTTAQLEARLLSERNAINTQNEWVRNLWGVANDIRSRLSTLKDSEHEAFLQRLDHAMEISYQSMKTTQEVVAQRVAEAQKEARGAAVAAQEVVMFARGALSPESAAASDAAVAARQDAQGITAAAQRKRAQEMAVLVHDAAPGGVVEAAVEHWRQGGVEGSHDDVSEIAVRRLREELREACGRLQTATASEAPAEIATAGAEVEAAVHVHARGMLQLLRHHRAIVSDITAEHLEMRDIFHAARVVYDDDKNQLERQLQAQGQSQF